MQLVSPKETWQTTSGTEVESESLLCLRFIRKETHASRQRLQPSQVFGLEFGWNVNPPLINEGRLGFKGQKEEVSSPLPVSCLLHFFEILGLCCNEPPPSDSRLPFNLWLINSRKFLQKSSRIEFPNCTFGL